MVEFPLCEGLSSTMPHSRKKVAEEEGYLMRTRSRIGREVEETPMRSDIFASLAGSSLGCVLREKSVNDTEAASSR